jgi:hypothetical protein
LCPPENIQNKYNVSNCLKELDKEKQTGKRLGKVPTLPLQSRLSQGGNSNSRL